MAVNVLRSKRPVARPIISGNGSTPLDLSQKSTTREALLATEWRIGTPECHRQISSEPSVFVHAIPESPSIAVENSQFYTEAVDQISTLVETWDYLGRPMTPGENPSSHEKAPSYDTERTAIGYAGRAALAMNPEEPWKIPVFYLGGYDGDAARWHCEVFTSSDPQDRSNAGFDATPWIRFYFPDTDTAPDSEDRALLQKMIGYVMSCMQNAHDYIALNEGHERRPDKAVEFDMWDLTYWLPLAHEYGVIDGDEFERYLTLMREYRYIPDTPGSVHSVMYFSAKDDPKLTVRAIYSNRRDVDHFLCRFFVPQEQRERIEQSIIPADRTGTIEISRLLYGDLSPFKRIQSFIRLKGGIAKLRGIAGKKTGLTVFAEVHPSLRERLGFQSHVPIYNGTTLSLQSGEG